MENVQPVTEITRREILTGTSKGKDKALSDLELTGSRADNRSVTLRVVLLSVLLAAFFGYIIPIVDYKMVNTPLGAAHLPVGAVGVLLVLLLVINPLLRLLARALAFSRNETLTIYITCLFSCLVPGKGAENFWVSNVIATFYLSTQENHWLEFVQPYLKPWFTPALNANGQLNRAVVENWYLAGGQIPWEAWLVPFVVWAALVLAIYFMLACLGVILRAQWAEREALGFPLLQLPIEMTRDTDAANVQGYLGGFLRSPMMWVGFVIVAFIQGLNGLHNYFPDVPLLPLQISTSKMFSEAPWNQLGPTTFLVWPMVFGLSYLLTTEVAFSLWFFYWFAKFQLIGAYYLGFQPAGLPQPTWTRGWATSFIAYQQVGAYVAYLALIFWVGCEHYRYVIRRGFNFLNRSTPPRDDEKREALSYPVAFWGFVLSFLFIIGWTVAAGVRLDIALALWLTYLMLALILTRVVAEGGLVFVQSGWAPLGPLAYLTGGGPGAWLAPSSVVPAAFIQGATMTDMRGFLLPSFVQSFKLAHDRGIAARPLLRLIGVCVVVAMLIGWWNVLRLGYKDVGGLQLENWWAKGNGATQPVSNAWEIVKRPPTGLGTNWLWLAVGGAMTWGMMWARSRFLWFPFHPIGLIMCWPTAMYSMWFSIFLGWLCKVAIMKYAGSEAYRKLLPFFLGIVLGDIASMLFWLLIDGWQGIHNHVLMP
jgi:hypothetical protein